MTFTSIFKTLANQTRWFVMAVSIAMSSCNTKDLNSIAAERVGGNNSNIAKVVEGATDFMIFEVRKSTSTAKVFFNKQFTKANGSVQVGIYKTSECKGTPYADLINVVGVPSQELSMEKIDRTAAFVCAWEVSVNGKIRNPAANNGASLAPTADTASTSSSTTGTSSTSSSANSIVDSNFSSSLHFNLQSFNGHETNRVN